MEKIRTTVRIAGHDYTLTSYDSQEHVQRVAKYVDRMVSDMNLATRLPAAQVAVLAAMSIADDMVKARDEVTKLKKELAELHAQLDAISSGKASE
ncbi:MAG: cell division protein ZapA [Clostridia bacterium]|nr:cell division protein ZapA [Clostridia bacterium]MBQ4085744.1 cell division protein ZapA [Clostridia bacterium]